jgi:hypothetical protein
MSLIYEDKVPISYRVPFVEKVKTVASNLGINPNWLMAIMYWESAKTFSPTITNSIGATGLIQFMPKTAMSLGTSTGALRLMSAVQQLDYVYKYYLPYKNKIQSYVDCYLITFFPIALGKSENFVLQAKDISAYAIASSNPAFDLNKDGKVTVAEIKQKMLEQLPTSWIPEFVKKKDSPLA